MLIKGDRFISQSASTIMVRVPGCQQKNFNKFDAESAIEHRNKLCKLAGINPKAKLNRGRRFHTDVHNDKTSDLPVGICFTHRNRKLADGEAVSYRSASAHSLSKAGPQVKSFSVIKYGEEKAVELAIEWRNETAKKDSVNQG